MSIRLRLLLAASVVLLLFVLITGLALQQATLQDNIDAQRERMQGLGYAVLGALEVENSGALEVTEQEIPEPRLLVPGSGLYAMILGAQGNSAWRSQSAPVQLTKPDQQTQVGSWHFNQAHDPTEDFTLAFGFRWASAEQPTQFTLLIIENAAPFYQARKKFNRNLWTWLLAPAGILLLLQLFILGWGLRPLGQLVKEITAIEQQQREQISGSYPGELSGLQKALNALLRQERRRQQVYKQSLDDLAHSLKTPLTVIRNTLEEPAPDKRLLLNQIGRMKEIITHRLKKAAAASTTLLSPSISILPIAERLVTSMGKVYPEILLTLDSSPGTACKVRMEESDLYELLGNLLDNACKWAANEVRISLACDVDSACIRIVDDGPGFDEQDISVLMKRGVRADAQLEGQGLGLSLCADIVHNLEGSIELANSETGGAEVSVCLPC